MAAAGSPPRLSRYQGGDVQAFLDRLVTELELAFTDLGTANAARLSSNATGSGSTYRVTNVMGTRTMDCSTATGPQAIHALGTVILDLQAKGVLP